MAAGDLAYDATANMMLSALTGANKSKVTTTSGISQEGMNAMLQQILQSTQGLAQVSSGQKSAGMYNSTVNTQMVNDLLTRATGEVQAQNKTTTQTTKTGSGLDGILQMMALSYGKKGLGTIWDKSGLGADANAVYEYFTGASSVSPTSLASANISADPLGALIDSQGWTAAEGTAAAATASSELPTATIASTGEVVGGGTLTEAGYEAVTSGAAGDSAALWEGADLAASGSSTVGAAEAGSGAAGASATGAEAGTAAAGAEAGTTAASGSTAGSTAAEAGAVAGYAYAGYRGAKNWNKYEDEGDQGGKWGTAAGAAIGAYFGGGYGAAIGAQIGGPIGSTVTNILGQVDDGILQPIKGGISDLGSSIGDIFGW